METAIVFPVYLFLNTTSFVRLIKSFWLLKHIKTPWCHAKCDKYLIWNHCTPFYQSHGLLKLNSFPEWKNQRFLCSYGSGLIGCNSVSFTRDYTWKMIQNGRLLSNSGSHTANMAPLVEQRVIVGVEWTAGGEVSNEFQLTLTFISLQFQFYSFYR